MAPRPLRAGLRPKTFSYLETEIFDYRWTKQEIDRRVREVAERGMGISYELQSHQREASPEWSDPTGIRGSAVAEDAILRHMTDVVNAIDHVLEQLDEQKRRLVELYYWRRWSRVAVCDAIGIDPRTFVRWRNAIVVALARRLGMS